MAGNTSKTARASSRAGRAASGRGFDRAADASRLVSLNSGTYAYIFTPDARTIHAAVGSDKFLTALGELAVAEPERIAAELAAMRAAHPGTAWDAVEMPASVESD